MKKLIILGIILSFLCGCGDKTITNDDYESAIKNIEYNNFKIMLTPALSSTTFLFDLNGKMYDYTTHEAKEGSFVAFIDNINTEWPIRALVEAFNLYDDTSISFYENGYRYTDGDFDYIVTDESEYASFSDQVGSCKYVIKNTKDNSLKSTCNKTQESAVKSKMDEFKKKMKSWKIDEREIKGLKNYILDNYYDSLAEKLNETYLNSYDDATIVGIFLDEAKNYIHISVDEDSYCFTDKSYKNAFVYYYKDKEIYGRAYINAELTGEKGYLISFDNGKTYTYSNLNDGSGCVVSIPFNTVIYEKTGNESSECTDKDFSNIDLFITKKNDFISSLSYGIVYPPISENSLQVYVESKIK